MLLVLSSCSKQNRLIDINRIEIKVLFSPEGFCNIGYNDLILKAIEKNALKYGFEYSIFIPEDFDSGVDHYNEWCNKKIENDIDKSLYIVTSNFYKDYLDVAKHPEKDSKKEILFFEVAEELPYAYSFAMSYYGSTYLAADWYLTNASYVSIDYNFQLIAANPYIKGLQHVKDALEECIKEKQIGKASYTYLSQLENQGVDDHDHAYMTCKLIEEKTQNDKDTDSDIINVYFPYCGMSNLGVYRFGEVNTKLLIGTDMHEKNFSYVMPVSMTKRFDLALDDFFNEWIKGKEVSSRYRLYDLESGRVEVFFYDMYKPNETEINAYMTRAIKKEKEYLSAMRK